MIGRRRYRRSRASMLAALMTAACLAGGCGQRGPLVLPKPPDRPAAKPPAADQAAPENERAQRRPAM
jgi:predicted small lipoprotein YifL